MLDCGKVPGLIPNVRGESDGSDLRYRIYTLNLFFKPKLRYSLSTLLISLASLLMLPIGCHGDDCNERNTMRDTLEQTTSQVLSVFRKQTRSR